MEHQRSSPTFTISIPPAGEVLENLDNLMGPEYHHPDTVYTQDQSVQFGSNKPNIAVDPTQQLFSSSLNQCYITETSTNISPTLQTKRSQSQALFTVPPESIHFTPVASSVDDTCPADSNQQQQRGKDKGGDQFGYDQLKKLRGF
ncbi:hypothetical protein N665_1177s0014 [Sinapis alba]|nr:hypothetical protein N665_1177s0014 [Sinapis alba]